MLSKSLLLAMNISTFNRNLQYLIPEEWLVKILVCEDHKLRYLCRPVTLKGCVSLAAEFCLSTCRVLLFANCDVIWTSKELPIFFSCCIWNLEIIHGYMASSHEEDPVMAPFFLAELKQFSLEQIPMLMPLFSHRSIHLSFYKYQCKHFHVS